jgi:hypothetical protein
MIMAQWYEEMKPAAHVIPRKAMWHATNNVAVRAFAYCTLPSVCVSFKIALYV